MSFKDKHHTNAENLQRIPVSNREAPVINAGEAPQLDRQEVAKITHSLSKTVKTICLYPPANSVCVTSRQIFSQLLISALDKVPELRLGVTNDGFTYGGEPVGGVSIEDDQLPALCYVCGITELTFSREITNASIELFLGILRSVITSVSGEKDLVEAFWGTTIDGFSYEKIEDLPLSDYESDIRAEYFPNQSSNVETGFLTDDDDNQKEFSQMFIDGPMTELEEPENEKIELFENIIETLSDDPPGEPKPTRPSAPRAQEMLKKVYDLDAEEAQNAALAIALDLEFSEEDALVGIGSDLIAIDEHLSSIIETVQVFGRSHTALVAQAKLYSAIKMLETLKSHRDRFTKNQPLWANKITEMISAVSSRERQTQLAQALNNSPDTTAKEFESYLGTFDWKAYAALSELLGELEHKKHRLALCEFLIKIDRSHIDLIASGLYDKRWYVVRNTALILSHFDDSHAHKHLLKATEHPERRVRLEVIRNISGHRGEYVCQVLLMGIRDNDDEIRALALQLALKQSDESTFPLFQALISHLGQLPEHMLNKILLGYSLCGKDNAVPELTKLAGKWSLFGKVKTEFRRQAMYALSRNSSGEARDSLRKLARSWNGEVRSLAKQALSECDSVNDKSIDKPIT